MGPYMDWIAQFVPVEALVPAAYARWRPLVRDAIQYVFAHLSKDRLRGKMAEQIAMPAETSPEARLIQLIRKMPALQKMGQVIARNRRISPALRTQLARLENGMSDVGPEEIRAIIDAQLGPRLSKYSVKIDPLIAFEASVSAVMRFTWHNPERERERGVFKVLKPYVPLCFTEDMTLLQGLGDHLASTDRGYGFAVRDVRETLEEVRTLLQHELDFPREQATLVEAYRAYRSSFGIRVPRPILPLCTSVITAMTEERGVKVTDACRHFPIRRRRIAEQLIEALIAIPLFSREDVAVFHADPHAGNLFYDEPNRELVVLDWALTERMELKDRRNLIMLTLMMMVRDRAAVAKAIRALSRRAPAGMIEQFVDRYFDGLPAEHSPGALDAMRLLDRIAMGGASFPAPLFLFRKILFTLDGVLHDVADDDVRIDTVMAREFLTRWLASFGLFHAPLGLRDFLALGLSRVGFSLRGPSGPLVGLKPTLQKES
jgi:ubiquinone biosynthesis protein